MIRNSFIKVRLVNFLPDCFKPRLSAMCTSVVKRKLYVCCPEDKQSMELTFVYSDQFIKDRKFKFNRSKDEKLSNAFNRMKCNIQNITEKKKKVKKKRQEDSLENCSQPESEFNIPISLQHGLTVLPEDTLNAEAWVHGALLKIGDSHYEVQYNVPAITNIKLPKSIMASFPIYPEVQLMFADLKETTCHWYRKVTKKELFDKDLDSIVKFNNEYFLKVGQGYYYIPSNEDIGYHLKVVCEPTRGNIVGESIDAVSPDPVGTGPGICPFDERHLYTETFAPSDSFRFITYNILADLYADRNHTREVLFPYCPEYALDIKYRKHLLLKEIIGYKPDVLCLQEVDQRVFENDLNPMLECVGLKGFMNTKGDQTEGLALFYKADKFVLLHNEAITLAKELPSDPLLADIYAIVSKNVQLKERVLTRTTILQLALLQSKEDTSRLLLVGNLHLYFHPDSDHIRLLQGSLCAKILEDRYRKIQNDHFPDKTCAPVLAGDFNSSPDCGIYQLMTEGKVGPDFKDWTSNLEEAVIGLTVSQSLKYGSACGVPAYTNFTLGFSGCLDYIYYDTTQLEVTEVVPQPSHELVTLNSALPSIVFPSDHLAQICTMKWT